MYNQESLRNLFEYDYWANRASLASIGSPEPGSRPLRLMAHMVGAQRVWISRLRGVPSPLEVWPDLDIDQCRAVLDELHDEWLGYLDEPAEVLDTAVGYTNTRGTYFETLPREILMHVILHGQYHRGQIGALIRQQGAEPAVVDYIVYVRE